MRMGLDPEHRELPLRAQLTSYRTDDSSDRKAANVVRPNCVALQYG